MRASSILMLLLAVLFGSGAVFVTKVWLDRQRSSMVTTADADMPATATVVVARIPLRFGDKLVADNLQEIPWPTSNIPKGAFSTREAMLKDGERYVTTAIEANEPVFTWKITGPGQRATLSSVVEAGKKAVTIRVDDVLGVAGFVLPGDRVDILLTRDAPNSDGPYVDVLIQGVKVLAIDQLADERADDPKVAKVVTLEVDTEQAQKLTLAAKVGQLSLALRNIAQGKREETRRVGVADLSADMPESGLPESEGGEEPQVTGSNPEVVYEGTRPPAYSTIGVMRGTERQEYQVRRSDWPFYTPWR
jgi:pilus assembly protein CpaB